MWISRQAWKEEQMSNVDVNAGVKAGPDGVREILIDPLVANGLRRKKSTRVRELEDMFDALSDGLSYMTRGKLAVLANIVSRAATGDDCCIWPAQQFIERQAALLQPKPSKHDLKITSYMRSKAGVWAYENDFALELHRWLREHSGVPDEGDIVRIKQEAQARRGRMARIQRTIDRGDTPSIADREWQEATLRILHGPLKDLVFPEGAEAAP